MAASGTVGPARAAAPDLVPIVAVTVPSASTALTTSRDVDIEVEIAGATVRVHGRPGTAALVDVFAALRRSDKC
ncbi:MAG: hypothetical protein WBP94_11295 [Rhodomicrobiaceae bacterium]